MYKIRQRLNGKSKEELVGLIENFVGKHPELESLIKTESAGITIKIRKLFSRFWEWNRVCDLTFQLDIILEGIRKDKGAWDKRLLNEMQKSADVIINGIENVHCEDEIAIFLGEWFETMGEVFVKTKPSIKEKEKFIGKIYKLISKDEYGNSDSFEKALFAMCKTRGDLDMIKKILNPLESRYPESEEHYAEFYSELGAFGKSKKRV